MSVLSGIKDIVTAAAKEAGSNAELFAVPFPGIKPIRICGTLL